MRFAKGFVLFESLLYGIMAMVATLFIVQSLRFYVDWQRASHTLLSSFLYEQRALFCLYKDLCTAHNVKRVGVLWVIEKSCLDAQWRPSHLTITYDCRKTGIFRQLKRQPLQGECIASSIRLWAGKVELIIEPEVGGHKVQWKVPERKPVIMIVPQLGARN